MKSQVIVSFLSIVGLVAAQQQDGAAGLHGHANAERAIEHGHRRHHTRPTTFGPNRSNAKATPAVELALQRKPLTRSSTSSSKAATPTSKTTIITTSKAATTSTTSSKASTTSTSTTVRAMSSSTATSQPIVSSSSSTPLAPAPVPTSGSPSYINTKKGISYNTINNTVPFAGSAGWAYDWYSDPTDNGLPKSMEFVPQLWSNGASLEGIWDAQVKAAIKNGTTHLLGFNEPDNSGQSDMTTDQAVTAWRKYMDPYAGQMKLVAPAITNGGAPSGVAWMSDFLAKCTGCHIDAIAMHWYDAAWNTGYFTGYFNDAITAFSPRPIWITEFRGSGTAAEQVTFINTVVPWMNANAGIGRYAIFGNYDGPADEGNMITGGQLNSVGVAYRDAK